MRIKLKTVKNILESHISSIKTNLLTKVAKINDLNDEEIEEIMKFHEKSIKEYYIKSGMGYKVKKSKKNIFEKKIVIILKNDTNLVAFISFKGEVYDGKDVIYCYELHVDTKYQGKGIGSILIKCLENIAQEFMKEKIVLTSIKINKDAFKFYEKMGFIIDETCPSKYNIIKPYCILCKEISI